MLITTMTSDELLHEYQHDLPEIQKRNKAYDQSSHVTHILDKHRNSSAIYCTNTYVTKRGNEYLNVFIYKRRRDLPKKDWAWDWSSITVGIMQAYKGTNYVIFSDEAQAAIRVQTHFFLRYKQRFMEVCDWKTKARLLKAKTVEDIIVVYISRNMNATLMNTEVKYIDKTHLFAPINDGAVLLQFDGETLQANTFITESMYSKHQKYMHEQARKAKEIEGKIDETAKLLVELLNGTDYQQS